MLHSTGDSTKAIFLGSASTVHTLYTLLSCVSDCVHFYWFHWAEIPSGCVLVCENNAQVAECKRDCIYRYVCCCLHICMYSMCAYTHRPRQHMKWQSNWMSSSSVAQSREKDMLSIERELAHRHKHTLLFSLSPSCCFSVSRMGHD